MLFCQYKDIFGVPNTGLHSLRIFSTPTFNGIAFVDFLSTLLVAWLISYFSGFNIFVVLLVLLLLGIFTHYLFCVDTSLNTLIGL